MVHIYPKATPLSIASLGASIQGGRKGPPEAQAGAAGQTKRTGRAAGERSACGNEAGVPGGDVAGHDPAFLEAGVEDGRACGLSTHLGHARSGCWTDVCFCFSLGETPQMRKLHMSRRRTASETPGRAPRDIQPARDRPAAGVYPVHLPVAASPVGLPPTRRALFQIILGRRLEALFSGAGRHGLIDAVYRDMH